MRFLIVVALVLGAVLALASLTSAAASFDVTAFTCNGGTSTDVAIGQSFNCEATVKNNGDADGTLSSATLSSGSGDTSDWLQQSSYSGSGVGSIPQSRDITVTFSNLIAKKTGNNGFSISLDNENDAGVGNTKVNVVNVNVLTTNSASSKAMGGTFTTTPQVTVGGNVDVTLTFTVDSGGCSIGNEASSKTQAGLTNGATWNPGAWTVTQGTSGDCKFTLTATADGANGAVTKTATSSSTITCTDCPTDSSDSSGSSGGGGGGAGGGKIIATLGELSESKSYELRSGESVSFTFGSESHSVSVFNLTETSARIVIKSVEQSFFLNVGEEKQVDFENDGKADVSVRLKSINIITKKALVIVTPLYVPAQPGIVPGRENGTAEAGTSAGQGTTVTSSAGTPVRRNAIRIIVIIIALAIIVVIVFFALRFFNLHGREDRIRRSILVRKP